MRAGSSPRVRGKLDPAAIDYALSRLIPACAGKTPLLIWQPRLGRAHPRVCGENSMTFVKLFHCTGSSPRVRGKHGGAASSRRRPGLIPACAGKTRASSRPSSLYRAHPRVCGENSPSHPASYTARGSSPRVRGKPSSKLNPRLFRGLIPACAGKTVSFQGMNALKPAHPRVCGENDKAPAHGQP